MRTLTLISLIFFVLVSCDFSVKNKVDSQRTEKNASTTISSEEEPAKTVIEFVKWYRDNMSSLNNIELINNAYSDAPDSTKLYSVNFKNVDRYLKEIKKCGYVSDKYINQLLTYFKTGDKYLLENPEYEGPPEGFNFDLVLWSQDYQEDLDNIDNTKFSLLANGENRKEIEAKFFGGSTLQFKLSKHNNKWLIDEITNDREE